jgi:hypothetical protein
MGANVVGSGVAQVHENLVNEIDFYVIIKAIDFLNRICQVMIVIRRMLK